MPKSTVIFDMDGILLDTENAILKVWVQLGEELGLDNVEEVFPSCVGTNHEYTKKIFHDAYGDQLDYEGFRLKSKEVFMSRVEKDGIPLMPYVREALAALENAGCTIGLASSTREQVVRMELTTAELLPYFRCLMCGDMVEYSKPHPEIYLKACANLGADPAAAWAIEDSYNGVRSAASAGMRVIMVPDMLPPTDEMNRLCETICSNILEAAEYILNN